MVTDFVFEYQGAKSSSSVDDFSSGDALVLNLQAYQAKQQTTGNKRAFVRAARGVQNLGFSDAAAVDDLVAKVTGVRQAGGQVGGVCISGYSLGSIYALRLAIQLKANDVSILYIGLSDLPIFPYGYIPSVAGFPSMIPENNPVLLV